MKKIYLALLAVLTVFTASAQSDRFEQKYDLLVSQFGPAGVGVETVLNNWEKVDSTNAKMLLGRFNYLFTKSCTTEVVQKPEKKYLGMEPVLTLKDSTGADIHYYQVDMFDDELYGEAMKAADKVVSVYPDRLDFRFLKVNAYIAYEKESPDMALSYLMTLVDEHKSGKRSWSYDGTATDDEFFQEAMQEYCFSFYSIGTPSSYEAFLKLSEKLAGLYPDNVGYVNNIGSYYLIAKQDYKTAIKYYNKVLKIKPDDYTAMRNGMTASRKMKNVKQEKKYLEMLVKYAPEKDRIQAQARLDVINGR